MGTAHWSDREIADFFHIDAVQARRLIDEIAARGFLDAAPHLTARAQDAAKVVAQVNVNDRDSD